MNTKIKVMEWNINQRLNYSKKDMPEWIANIIIKKEADIVILTECFKGNNWEKVKKKAFLDRHFSVYESENQGIQNDVVIAISDKFLPIKQTLYCSKDHNVPDYLKVRCKYNNTTKLTIAGIRIHASATDQEKEIELKFALDDLKNDGNVIIGGDLNNNRRGFNKKGFWNLKRMDEIFNLYSFVRKTPNGSSIWRENYGKVDYEFAEDHFIIKGNFSDFILDEYDRGFVKMDESIYKWNKDFQIYLGKDIQGKSKYNSISSPYPDHAILFGTFELRD